MSDVDAEMGPLGAIPGSHNGRVYDHYDQKGEWTGALSDRDTAALPIHTAEYMGGKAGILGCGRNRGGLAAGMAGWASGSQRRLAGGMSQRKMSRLNRGSLPSRKRQ